jgi:uncharacterized protein
MKKLIIFLFLISSFCFSQEKLNVFDIARKGTVEQAKEVLKENPKAFDVVNEEHFSPLLLACYRGNNEVANFLIDIGINVNEDSSRGSLLMACVVKNNIEVTKKLVDHNCNVNAFDSNGTTSLIYAVQFQNVEILKLLVQHNVDKTHKDKEGKTAFEYAVFSGNEQIINLLK